MLRLGLSATELFPRKLFFELPLEFSLSKFRDAFLSARILSLVRGLFIFLLSARIVRVVVVVDDYLRLLFAVEAPGGHRLGFSLALLSFLRSSLRASRSLFAHALRLQLVVLLMLLHERQTFAIFLELSLELGDALLLLREFPRAVDVSSLLFRQPLPFNLSQFTLALHFRSLLRSFARLALE